MLTPTTEPVRRAAIALIAGALITAIGGAAAQIVQASSSVSQDLWRYPWSSDAFVPISLLWAIAHALVIAGLLGLRRSALAGPGKDATVGLSLAVAGTALLLAAEFASLPFANQPVDNTGPAIVGALFGLGSVLSGIGLLITGRAALRAGRWEDWRRFTPLIAGAWTIVPLTAIAMTNALPTGIAIYGICLLAIGIAMYTRPAAANSALNTHHTRTA